MNTELTPWIDLIKSVGPAISLIMFFIWRDWRREDSMSKRILQLEEYQTKTLSSLVEKTTEAIIHNTNELKLLNRRDA